MARIKNAVILLILIFFPIFVGCFAQTEKNVIVQKKADDGFTWDFGKVQQGKVVVHEFTLKNETKKVLKVKDLTTSCGCTASKIKEKTIASGKSTSIEVKFNSKGYSGPVEQHIYVNTDNLDNPVTKFMIKADVVK